MVNNHTLFNGSLQWKKRIFTSISVKETKLPTVTTIYSTFDKNTYDFQQPAKTCMFTISHGEKFILFYSIVTFFNAAIYNYAAENIISTTKTKQNKIQNHCNDIDGLALNKQIKYLENAISISMVCILNINNINNIHSTGISKTIISRNGKHYFPSSMLLRSVQKKNRLCISYNENKMKMRIVLIT